MKILTSLTASNGLDVSSTNIDNIVLGTSGTQNNDINIDNLTVWANANFKNNVVLGLSAQDTITALAPISASAGLSASIFVGNGSGLTNVSSSSHNAVTIGISNGLSINESQVLSLASASVSSGGAITTGSQTIAGNKVLSGSLILTENIGIGTDTPSSKLELSGTNSFLTLNTVNSVSTPQTNKLSLFAKNYIGKTVLHQQSSVGKATSFQSDLAHNSIGIFLPQGANTTTVPPASGVGFTTIVGTATGRAIATTNALTRMRRLGLVSANPAGSFAHLRTGSGTTGTAQFTTGDGAAWALGGFLISFNFGISDTTLVSGARMFVGLWSGITAPTNVEPTTLINSIGIAQLSSDATQLHIVYGGTTPQTSIPLGSASFPISNTIPYEVSFYSPSTLTGRILYEVTNLSTGASVTGDLTGNSAIIPSSTVLLAAHVWRTNRNTTGPVAVDIGNIYLEREQ